MSLRNVAMGSRRNERVPTVENSNLGCPTASLEWNRTDAAIAHAQWDGDLVAVDEVVARYVGLAMERFELCAAGLQR